MAVYRRGESCPHIKRTDHQATCAWQSQHESLQTMRITNTFCKYIGSRSSCGGGSLQQTALHLVKI